MKNLTASILQKKKKQILELWMKNQLSEESLRDDLMNNDELRKQSEELLLSLSKAIDKEKFTDIDTPEFEPIKDLLGEISLSRASQGYSPRETGLFVLSLKAAIMETLEKELNNDPVSLYKEILGINKIMDNLTILTFESYIKGREEVIIRQTDEISEISTPVIRVWDGILALPIIGTLDSERTQVVMENLLEQIVASESSIAILDISGVPAVDSLVAQHLIKTVSATRLMGAECIISGIRPEIAQTIVHLGIDLSSIQTKSSLASALKLAFQMRNIEVVKKSERKTSSIK